MSTKTILWVALGIAVAIGLFLWLRKRKATEQQTAEEDEAVKGPKPGALSTASQYGATKPTNSQKLRTA